jgi:hypothetical protein
MRKILERCPTCGGSLDVTELQCQQCHTQVRSRYSPCAFCTLTTDQLVFVKLFVEKRGNLREMEKALGVSYPTVRGKLEEIAERLSSAPVPAGGAPQPASGPEAEARREVLRLIAEGRLSVKEGLARLRAGQPAREPGEAPSSPEK